MQQLLMKLKHACQITSVILVLASAAPTHLVASTLEQQILSAIARGDDISAADSQRNMEFSVRVSVTSEPAPRARAGRPNRALQLDALGNQVLSE
jgi:hypothetical protein